jgi:hypothetical protein
VVEATQSVAKVEGVVGRIKSAASTAVTSLSGMASKAHATATNAMNKIEATSKKSLMPGGVAGQLAGMALGGISVEGIKSAIESTEQLGKTTEALHTVTGMSIKDASSWSAVLSANGIQSTKFGMALKNVATTTDSFKQGLKAGTTEFKELGINMSEVKARAGDTNAMFELVADRFNKMPAGVAKTELATKLFGRSWQQLIPILSQGSKGMEEQRAEAQKLGATMDVPGTKSAVAMHEAQVQLKLATIGLETTFAQQLAPTLFKVLGIMVQLLGVIMVRVHPAFVLLGKAVHDVSNFFKEHQTLLKAVEVVIALLIAQYIASKLAILGARAAMIAINLVTNLGRIALFAYRAIVLAVRAAMLIWQGTIWLVNAALDANPIAIVIIAIIALVAAVVVIATHFKQFKQIVSDVWTAVYNFIVGAVNAVIGFLKKNWPLLLAIFSGPFAPIILVITKFRSQALSIFNDLWKQIQSIFGGVVNAIESPFKSAWQFLSNLHIKITTTHIGPISVPSGISVSGAAAGGIVPTDQPVLIGERGPELLNLPRGAQVTPLPRAGMQPVAQNASMPPLVVSVQIQRKEIANAVAKFNSDALARK